MAPTDTNMSSAENKGYAILTDILLPNDVGWYEVDASCISDHARKLLENWSEIPPDQIYNHVNAIVSKFLLRLFETMRLIMA